MKTRDKSPLKFYVTETIGQRRHMTPDGFLVIEEVPIARTGEMMYGPNETPISVGPDGVVHITRDADEVFRPETIASFLGKPIIDEHTREDVNAKSWRDHARGTVMNVRRGEGAMSEFLIADMLICDHEAIQLILDGKREVSCGYAADYEQTAPGRGRQTNIIGNHVALVERGRCGPRCAIGDHAKTLETSKMSNEKKSLVQRIRDALSSKDEAAIKIVTDEMEAMESTDSMKAVRDSIAEFGGRIEKMETRVNDVCEAVEKMSKAKDSAAKVVADAAAVAEDAAKVEEAAVVAQLVAEAPATLKVAAATAKDSAFLSESFQETMSLAEVLTPGIQAPTFDATADPKKTLDAICGLRRKALDAAYAADPAIKAFADTAKGAAPDFASMTCDAVRALFTAAAAIKKAANNTVAVQALDARTPAVPLASGIKTPADLNKYYAEKFAPRTA